MVRAGIDWGSSGFRAYRFDDDGALMESLESPLGIKFCHEQGFEKTLFDSIGHWLQPGDRVILSGMITSRNGWIESDYLPCPADLHKLGVHGATQIVREIDCLFLPGVSQTLPPDIMRGEELQLLGVTSPPATYRAIIPGTHSKWVTMHANCIQSFRTIATGELYEVLLQHSLIGALANVDHWDEAVFLAAVETGFNTNTIVSDLFTCRSGVLLNSISASDSRSHLSGLLVGNEIREGLSKTDVASSEYVLIGSETLCRKYEKAFIHLGFSVTIEPPLAATRGYQKLIEYLAH